MAVIPGLSLSAEDVERLSELSSAGAPRDGRVCICGHPMSRHTLVDLSEYGRGVVESCEPVRTPCECKHPKPVVEASDTRLFLRKTTGHAERHGLVRGLIAANDKGVKFEWLEGWPKCELSGWPGADVECEAFAGVLPYGFDNTGRALGDSAAWNFLLCRPHADVALRVGWPSS